MESDRFAATWHEAADRANYDFYEPDSDQYRSAGNYSGDGNQIGVCGLVDEHTVHVETWSSERQLDDATIRQLSVRQVWAHSRTSESGELSEVDETMIEDDERVVVIAETSYACPGVRVRDGHHWAGTTLIGDTRLRIITTSPLRRFALRVCANPDSLLRTPPARRP